MKFVRIIGVDAGCERLIPFAKKKLAQLAATSGGNFAIQNMHVDEVSIRVKVYTADEGTIELRCGGASYRFFTTGPDLQKDFDSGVPLYHGHAVQVVYDPVNDRLKGKPLGSTLKQDFNIPERWPYYPQADGINAPLMHIWQVEGITEHMHYDLEGEQLLTPWGSERDQAGLNRHSSMFQPRESIDLAYDAPPTTFKRGRSVRPQKVPDMDWYRRGALRTVTHPEFGTRKFIIMTDVSHGFAAYPTTTPVDVDYFPDEQQIKTTLSETAAIKRFTPTLPAWAEVSASQAREGFSIYDYSVDRTIIDHPQTLWKFNRAGTRCAALLKHTFPAAPFPNLSYVGGGTHFFPNGGKTHKFRFLDDSSLTVFEDRDSLPGFVEYTIDIELTGRNPEDFTFYLTQVYEEDPRTSNKYPIGIDYAWDIGKPALQEEGDLIVLYGEVWHTCTGPADRYHDHSMMFVFKNMNKDYEFLKIRGEGLVITGHKFNNAYEPAQNAVLQRRGLPRPYPGTLSHDVLQLNISAIDLRICAYVLERRLIRKVESSEERICAVEDSAVKIEVVAWGDMAEEKWLTPDGALNGRLDELTALDPTTALGYVKYPTANPGGTYWSPVVGDESATYDIASDVVFAMASGFVEGYFITTGAAPAAIIPLMRQSYMGAKVYAQRIGQALTMTPWSLFQVHPHGHWSVSTPRCAFYCGESKLSFCGPDEDGFDKGLDRVGPDLYDIRKFKQAFVDIVSFRLYERQEDGTVVPRDVRGKHWELAKEAYDEPWVEEDFFLNVEAVDIPAPPRYPAGSVLHAVKFSSKYDPGLNAYLKLWATKPSPLNLFDPLTPRYFVHLSPQFMELGRHIPLISSYRWTVNSQMLNGVLGPNGTSSYAFVGFDESMEELTEAYGRLCRDTVLNGSAMFIGTVTTEPPKVAP